MFKEIKLEELVIDLLGPLGKTMSPFKLNDNGLILRNANIFIAGKKVWYGDIDIILYKERLKTIAKFCGKKIIITEKKTDSFKIYTIRPD